MKNIIFTLLLGLTTISFAQEKGKFRGGLETGFSFHEEFIPIPNVLAMELKYNFYKNMNAGFRTVFTSIRTCKCYSTELLSFSFTYDYYFHYKNSLFSPFVGAGLGYYFGGGYEHGGEYDEGIYQKHNNPTCFARVGLEIWKIRIAFDYNLIRDSKYFNSNKNLDYMSITVGFYIGGGKWKKKQE